MALNLYQTPTMVLGGITQDPYHLNVYQMPVMVLGTTEAVSIPEPEPPAPSGATIKMSHPYSIQPIIPANGTQNGSMVTFVAQGGSVFTKKRSPDVNKYIDSGVMNIRTSGRFDETYGGGGTSLWG